MPMIRRRPLLRATAIRSGAYYEGKRRIETHERATREQARLAELEGRKAKLLGG